MSRRVDRVRQAIEDEIAELGALDVCDPRHMRRLAEAALAAAETPTTGLNRADRRAAARGKTPNGRRRTEIGGRH